MSVYFGFASGRATSCFLWHLRALLITLCLASTSGLADSVVGEFTLSETIPHHVQIPIGGNANITCTMNKKFFEGNNSSCLSFFNSNRNSTIPKEHTHILNDTSVVYMIRDATEQFNQYICKCNTLGVDITWVYVGTPPINVTDFRCRAYDFTYMTCNFTIPENKILTDYKLNYSIHSPGYITSCDLTNGIIPSERICNITTRYRIVYPKYNFTLIANNSLGILNQSISIDHFAIVVPAKPDVKFDNITANSVTLTWIILKYSHYRHTNGILFEIRLRPENFDWIDIDSSLIQNSSKDFWIEIKDLEYAFRKYDVSLRMKAVSARNDGTTWSEPFYGSFVTSPRRPDNPPAMDVGSFYIDSKEQNVRLYWQQLPEYRENGPNFQYVITEIQRDGKAINITPVSTDHTSATYQWQSTSYYQFKVKSQNQLGQSLNASILQVQPSLRRPIQLEQLKKITKVYHNQSYTISWQQPGDLESLINFTVFWCISKMESQSQCKGTINFKHVDKSTYNYTTEPQNHTMNFAVSANYRKYSTGMIWAMCTADVGTDLPKMDPETTPLSSNSIKVQWSTECLFPTEGYNLTYCKVENNISQMTGDCIETETTISISKLAKEYIITGLDPYTTYKISILMYSTKDVGPVSNPVLETTTEDAPTPPRKLKYQNVTSDSAVISWLPPKHSNGHLRFYTVWDNNDHHIVNSTINDTETEISFKLDHLSSFTDYKVYVTAHTVKSSAPSNDIHIKTLISVPSTPRSLNIKKSHNSLELSWDTPIFPSGPINFYEIRVNVLKNNETETNKISRVIGNKCKINLPPCLDRNYEYTFDVRAVNVDKKSEDYYTISKRDTSMYVTIHQGAVKRRRHSNAEINSSIGKAYEIQETSQRRYRHRHERENLKSTSTSTTELPFEKSDDIFEDSSDGLMCIGGQQDDLRRYNDLIQYKLYNGPFANGGLYACGEAQFSKITLFAVFGVLSSLLISAALYTARKKYYKMSSIGLVIPAGLDESIHTPKGVDNAIEHDEIMPSDELYFDKENHHLLSKIGNDSGFLNSVQCLDKNSAFVCSDHQDSEKSSQSTDSVELNDITSCSYTSSPSHSPNANVRETATPEETFTPVVIQPTSVQLRPSDNGYIKPMMMSNGYVQPQALQKMQTRELPSFNGYTTLDAMGKPVFSPVSAATAAPIGDNSFGMVDSKAVSIKDIATPQPMNGNICGYVTHKQLSDFGQRLQ